MAVWRLHLRPEDVDHDRLFQFCLDGNVLGAGWRVAEFGHEDRLPDGCTDVDAYWAAARVFHAGLPEPRKKKWWGGFVVAANVLSRRMAPGDLCWSRDTVGNYHIARIADDPFTYRTGGNWDALDLHMTRTCEWAVASMPPDQVPGVIRRRFVGATRTIEGVRDPNIGLLSERMFDLLHNHHPIDPIPGLTLFDLLGPEEAEDLVAFYLQDLGWRVVVSTAKSGTPEYECVLRDGIGRRAAVQVKTGGQQYFAEASPQGFDHFYVFNANGAIGDEVENVTYLTLEAIEEYAAAHPELIPDYVRPYIG